MNSSCVAQLIEANGCIRDSVTTAKYSFALFEKQLWIASAINQSLKESQKQHLRELQRWHTLDLIYQ
jgi:hypothetical protein